MDLKESGCELDSCSSGWGSLAGCHEHSNEPSGSLKGREFDWLSNH
jgi:hypothetical protein